eukprot:scaffold87654_cov69-Phaeocystis_antarctica.AAC.9
MAQRTSVATNVRLSVSPSTSSSEGRWVGLAIGGLWVQPPPASQDRPTTERSSSKTAALWWRELCTAVEARFHPLKSAFKRQSTKHYTKRLDPLSAPSYFQMPLRFTKLLGARR